MRTELRRRPGSRNHHANRHAWACRHSASWLVLNDTVFGSELGAVTGSLDDDLVSGVGQPVQSAIAEDRIVEQAQPFVHAAIGSDGETRAPVTFDDQLVQVVALLGGETAVERRLDLPTTRTRLAA